jgi:hypothetical protein
MFFRRLRQRVASIKMAVDRLEFECEQNWKRLNKIEELIDERFEQIYKYTDEKYRRVDEWDSLQREKINVITDHLGIELDNGVHVIIDSLIDSETNSN